MGQELAEFDHQGVDGPAAALLHLQILIEGEVPVVPYPGWSQGDAALASVARLLRGLHDAARGFDARGLSWDEVAARYEALMG